jgi:hypothetical protein
MTAVLILKRGSASRSSGEGATTITTCWRTASSWGESSASMQSGRGAAPGCGRAGTTARYESSLRRGCGQHKVFKEAVASVGFTKRTLAARSVSAWAWNWSQGINLRYSFRF